MNNMTAENALRRLPEAFWAAFAGELVSVFGLDILEKDADGQSPLFYIEGTAGWNAALRMTCAKLSLDWLYDWYDTLEWYDSDEFDSVLAEGIGENFVMADMQNTGPYYLWLVENETR